MTSQADSSESDMHSQPSSGVRFRFSLLGELRIVNAIAIDGDGHKWFGTEGGGVSEFDGSRWTNYTTADGLASNYVNAIAIDGADHKWFGTESGVSEFDGGSWATYTSADGLANDYVYAVAIDSAGRKWFGTSGGGVSEFDGTSWTTYTVIDGLADNSVFAIASERYGRKWFGTYGGVSVYDEALAPVRTYLPMLVNGPSGAGKRPQRCWLSGMLVECGAIGMAE